MNIIETFRHMKDNRMKQPTDTIKSLHEDFKPEPAITQSRLATANDKQIDGEHYTTQPIQTWDYISQNNLSFMQGNAIKYIARCYKKHDNPLPDLLKAQHYIEKLIEIETAKRDNET